MFSALNKCFDNVGAKLRIIKIFGLVFTTSPPAGGSKYHKVHINQDTILRGNKTWRFVALNPNIFTADLLIEIEIV